MRRKMQVYAPDSTVAHFAQVLMVKDDMVVSVTRLGDLLEFWQLFKEFGNN